MSTAEAPATDAPAVLDCFSCRLIGTGAFAGLGIYAITMSRYYASNKAISAGPGATLGIRLIGYGFLAAAAARWTMPMRSKKEA